MGRLGADTISSEMSEPAAQKVSVLPPAAPARPLVILPAFLAFQPEMPEMGPTAMASSAAELC